MNEQWHMLRNLEKLKSASVTVPLGFFVASLHHFALPVLGSSWFIDRFTRIESKILGVLATLFVFLALALLLYSIIQLYLFF